MHTARSEEGSAYSAAGGARRHCSAALAGTHCFNNTLTKIFERARVIRCWPRSSKFPQSKGERKLFPKVVMRMVGYVDALWTLAVAAARR